MICPICKTNNTHHQDTEFCVQCGADLHVHHLLRGVREEIQMKNELTKPEYHLSSKPSRLLTAFQMAPTILLLICAMLGIYVGMVFLQFLDRAQSHPRDIANKWSETGFEQLQQMNATIKQELDLIMDQHRENQVLKAKVEELTALNQKDKTEVLPALNVQEGQQ